MKLWKMKPIRALRRRLIAALGKRRRPMTREQFVTVMRGAGYSDVMCRTPANVERVIDELVNQEILRWTNPGMKRVEVRL